MILARHSRLPHIIAAARRAFAGYKTHILALIGLGFLSGIFEGIGINAIIPLFSFIAEGADLSQDPISRAIRALFSFFNISYRLPTLLFFIALLFLLKAFAVFFSKYLTDKIRETYILETRSHLFSLTLQAKWPYLMKHKIGYLEKVLVNDINNSAGLLTHISGAVILLTNATVYTLIALNISVPVTLITLILGGIIFLVFKPLVYKAKSIAQRSAEIMKATAHHINESMIGIKTVKSAHIEEAIAQRAHSYFTKLKNIQIRLSILDNFTYVAIQPISVGVILLLFLFMHSQEGFQFASFIVIVYAINKIFTYIQSAQGKLNSISTMYPFLQAVLQYEREAEQHAERSTGKRRFSFTKEMQFKDVSFSYGRESHETLSSVSLTLPRGSVIGIVGPSGSGKTTIVDLLLRLIYPTEGEISMDGIPIEKYSLASWRNNIGYMSQDLFFLNDTIANNITLLKKGITKQNIQEAARQADIHDFIMSLPQQYDTVIGERGIELSGGQRQRVALARALAQQPSLLILDEATSSLDVESEQEIIESLQQIRKKTTILIITHRPSGIRLADHVYVLEEGRITEEGNPKKLLQSPNSYLHRMSDEQGI